MTFQQFLEQYNGKYIDFDGAYGAQCMDLMHQYCVEVLGITDHTVLAAACARDVYNNFQTVSGHDLFDQIGNTPSGVPQEGDIMFWGNAPYGHVAVFISGDTNSFQSFDQNFPTGSPCHTQNHTYANVLGWLRFKGLPDNGQQALIDQLRAERDTNWNLYQNEQKAKIDLEDAVAKKQTIITDLTNENQTLKDQVAQIPQIMADKVAAQQALLSKQNDLTKTQMDLDLCKSQRKDLDKYQTRELLSEIFSRLVRR
jgi:hypothetical protein